MRGDRTKLLGGAAVMPLAVLFGLNFVDEFDRIAFATLTPEIRDTFGLDDTGIGAVANLSALFPLFFALPTGLLADRVSRVRLAIVSALLWGGMSVLTGLVPTVGLLLVVRALSGVGRNANEIVHPSLLTDLYPDEVHPRVFQFHRMANPASAISGIAAGWIGSEHGWEWAFIVLAVPTFICLLGLADLREPPRTTFVVDHTGSARMSLLAARRELAKLASLRRFWAGGFFLGAIQAPIASLLSLFFENVYDFGPQARGWVQFLYGAGTVTGLAIGGAVATRRIARHEYAFLATFSGMGFAIIGVAALGAVLSPVAALSVAFAALAGAGNGLYQPSYYTAVGKIAPGNLSAQAYAWGVVFFGLGAIATIPVFTLGEEVSYRLALGSIAVFGFAAALIARSAGRHMESDIAFVESVALDRAPDHVHEPNLVAAGRSGVALDEDEGGSGHVRPAGATGDNDLPDAEAAPEAARPRSLDEAWVQYLAAAESRRGRQRRHVTDAVDRGALDLAEADRCLRVLAPAVLEASGPTGDASGVWYLLDADERNEVADRLRSLPPVTDAESAVEAAVVARAVGALAEGWVPGSTAIANAMMALTCPLGSVTADWVDYCLNAVHAAGLDPEALAVEPDDDLAETDED